MISTVLFLLMFHTGLEILLVFPFRRALFTSLRRTIHLQIFDMYLLAFYPFISVGYVDDIGSPSLPETSYSGASSDVEVDGESGRIDVIRHQSTTSVIQPVPSLATRVRYLLR